MAKKDRGYKRTVRCRTKDYEIVEIEWGPGSATPPHDHGTSSGFILVLEGTIFEEVYEEPTRSFLMPRLYGPGSKAREFSDTIHVMGNQSKTRKAKTLHVYWPPLRMKEFTREELLKW